MVLVLGVPVLAMGTDALQRFRAETFSSSTDLSTVPDQVRVALTRFVGGAKVANSTEAFEATDVISDPNVPRRRLVIFGTSADLTFIEYDHGGIGLHQHFVLFQRSASAQDTLVFACAGVLPRDLAQLKEAVGTLACPKKATGH